VGEERLFKLLKMASEMGFEIVLSSLYPPTRKAFMPCIQKLNTHTITRDGVSFKAPIVTSAAINIVTKEVCPVTFEDRGPEVILRCLLSMAGVDTSLRRIDHEILSHTDEQSKPIPSLKLGPWKYNNIDGIDFLLKLDDSQFLQFTSTSPLVEGPNFVPDAKSAFKFLKMYPIADVYFGGKPLIYIRENSTWKRQ